MFFFVWFSVGLTLHLQIFPLDMTVADRWFYFPFVGLLGMIALGILSLKRYKKLLTAGYIVGISMLIFFSLRTVVRNTNWSNPITLYSHDIALNDNADLESNLGFEYGLNGDYKEDLNHSLKAITLSPTESGYYNAGYAYERMGNITKAKEYYYLTLTTKNYVPQNGKRSIMGYVKVIVMQILSDELGKAKDLNAVALRNYPDSVQLWFLLAISEYKLHNRDEALFAAKKVEVLYPAAETQTLYSMIYNDQPMELSLKSFPIVWINQ
jgi:tetratricopeptide (TPR) repeat protein